MDFVHAAMQSHDRQNAALKQKVSELEASGPAGKERARQIQIVLKENSEKVRTKEITQISFQYTKHLFR